MIIMGNIGEGIKILKEYGIVSMLKYFYKKLIYTNDDGIVERINFIDTFDSIDATLFNKEFGESCSVSVIIPVYNSQLYIEECLNSIFSQSFKDFEVICVDDGSTDCSLEILKRYESKFKNMKVITQKNLFAGAARNSGMDIANGEYIFFVDSDDFIDKYTIEKIYSKAKEKDADLVVFGMNLYDHIYKKVMKAKWLFREKYIPSKDPFNYKDMPDYIFNFTNGGPCNKLFSASKIKQYKLKFPDFRSSNDIGFVLPFFTLAENITTVRESLYYYRMGHGTNLSSTKDKVPTLFFEAYKDLQYRLKSYGVYEAVKQSFVNITLGGCLYEINSIKSSELREKTTEMFFEEYVHIFEIDDKPMNYFSPFYRYMEYIGMKRKYMRK